MEWWKGRVIEYGKEVIRCDSAYTVLDGLCRVPKRPTSAPMRMAVFGVFNFKGVDIALTGRVEQGMYPFMVLEV